MARTACQVPSQGNRHDGTLCLCPFQVLRPKFPAVILTVKNAPEPPCRLCRFPGLSMRCRPMTHITVSTGEGYVQAQQKRGTKAAPPPSSAYYRAEAFPRFSSAVRPFERPALTGGCLPYAFSIYFPYTIL